MSNNIELGNLGHPGYFALQIPSISVSPACRKPLVLKTPGKSQADYSNFKLFSFKMHLHNVDMNSILIN